MEENKSAVSSVFIGIRQVITDAIVRCGDNADDYIIKVYPTEIERKDKKPLSRKVHREILKSFSVAI